jgi:hypothetical protein
MQVAGKLLQRRALATTGMEAWTMSVVRTESRLKLIGRRGDRKTTAHR